MSVSPARRPYEDNEGVAILSGAVMAWPRGPSVTLPKTGRGIVVDLDESELDESEFYTKQAKEFEASIARALRNLLEIHEELVQRARIPDIEQDIFVRMKPRDSFVINARANYLGQATPRVVIDLVEYE